MPNLQTLIFSEVSIRLTLLLFVSLTISCKPLSCIIERISILSFLNSSQSINPPNVGLFFKYSSNLLQIFGPIGDIWDKSENEFTLTPDSVASYGQYPLSFDLASTNAL
jgi:hypothetical protein